MKTLNIKFLFTILDIILKDMSCTFKSNILMAFWILHETYEQLITRFTKRLDQVLSKITLVEQPEDQIRLTHNILSSWM